ncbi:hypothetical protein ACFLRM_05610 [Acidobacteriota bacterium]
MSQETQKSEAHDALQKIRESEEEARRIINGAREETSVQIVQDAYDEAKKIKEQYLSEGRNKAEDKKKTIIQKAAEEADKIRKESEEEAAALVSSSETRKTGAIDNVAEKIKLYLKRENL